MSREAHKHDYLRGGEMEGSWIQPTCSCGWIGSKHYAYNDYQHSNAREQLNRHRAEHQRGNG